MRMGTSRTHFTPKPGARSSTSSRLSTLDNQSVLQLVNQFRRPNEHDSRPTAADLLTTLRQLSQIDSNEQLAPLAAPLDHPASVGSPIYELTISDLPRAENSLSRWRREARAQRSGAALLASLRIMDELLATVASQEVLEEALQIHFFVAFLSKWITNEVDHCQALMRSIKKQHPQWKPKAATVRLLLAILFREAKYRKIALLLRVCGDALPPDCVLDLAATLLRSPVRRHRLRARESAERVILQAGAELSALPPQLLSGLLWAFCRAEHGWADSALAERLARHIEESEACIQVMRGTQTPGISSLVWMAIVAQRAMSLLPRRSSESDMDTRHRNWRMWLSQMQQKGLLEQAWYRDLASMAVQRALSDQFDACETEQEILRFFRDTKHHLPAATSPRRLSWGWGIRVLLGRSSSFVGVYDPVRWRTTGQTAQVKDEDSHLLEPAPSPLHTHEANLLLDRYCAASGDCPPSFMMIGPLLYALVRQFPPQTTRAVEIYSLAAGCAPKRLAQSSRWAGRLPFLSSMQSIEQQTPMIAPEATDLILRHLLQRQTQDVKAAETILSRVLQSGATALFGRRRRAELAVIFLSAVARTSDSADTRGRLAFWWRSLALERQGSPQYEALFQESLGHNASTPARVSWFSRFGAKEWDHLFYALVGPPEAIGGHSSEQSRTLPLCLLPHVVKTELVQNGNRRKRGHLLYILQRLSRLAAMEARNWTKGTTRRSSGTADEFSATSDEVHDTVAAIHTVIAQHQDRVVVDEALVTALMGAYSRNRAGQVVHELWEMMVINTVRGDNAAASISSSSSSLPLTSTVPAAPQINQINTGVYLDACGWSRAEALGRRAWAFAGKVEANRRARGRSDGHIRGANTWTSWLEFLCRLGHLHEAIGTELDKMMAECPIGVDAKTLRTVLAFCAAARARGYGEQSSRLEAPFYSTELLWQNPLDASRAHEFANIPSKDLWWFLRARIYAGRYGPDLWEHVKLKGGGRKEDSPALKDPILPSDRIAVNVSRLR